MTKVTTLEDLLKGKQQEEQPKKKPIELVKALDADIQIKDAATTPTDWNTLVLLEEDYGSGYDLILAYDKIQSTTVYLGHWNDGVVE